MAAVGRTWGWLRSWGRSHNPPPLGRKQPAVAAGGWASWVWGGWRGGERGGPVEEFWEAQEKLPGLEADAVGAGRVEEEDASRWWNRFVPTWYLWPRAAATRGQGQRTGESGQQDALDGDFSDYGTPPPSPTPSQLASPFRFFASSWNLEIVPEHYEICFNFLRHLFDLCVVAFLWAVSPPVKVVLEVLGLQGALRLWFHGMAMFFVSTAGMAGVLWLIQEYLPQFALIYGVVQALVISVSVRQAAVLVGVEEERRKEVEEADGDEERAESEENVSRELLKSSLA